MDIIDRFKNQRVAQSLHWKIPSKTGKPHRICNCFRLKRERSSHVSLLKRPQAERAHYSGLQTCGSVWSCSVCGSIISERRKEELQRDIDIWREKDSCNTVLMITFTTPHYRFQSLADVLKCQDDAIRIMKNQPQRKRYKVWRTIMGEILSIGSFTGREITFGLKNGWHPHRHEAHFTVRSSVADLAQAREDLITAFAIAFEKAGGVINDMKAFRKHAVRLDQVNDDDGYDRISTYITKVEGDSWTLAQEATKGIIKDAKNGNITPQGMLTAIRLEDPNADLYKRKFMEYALTVHGKKQFWPTNGLKKFFGTIHLSDSELISENDALSNLFAMIQNPEWEIILKNGLRGQVLEMTAGKNDLEFYQELDYLIQQFTYSDTG